MDGFIIINKKENMTSRDVVNIVCKKLHTKKVGHTGTLDPMAKGVLVVAVNKALKLVDDITSLNKEYIAEVTLGIKTDTLDITGNILEKYDVKSIDKEKLETILKSFIGKYDMEVPIYSAVKVNGKKLYEYAREGKNVELPRKIVYINSIELLNVNGNKFTFKCNVSKGTYIRSLCDDIGTKLGCYGCMKELLRTKVACFDIGDAYKISEIEKLKESIVLPVDMLFENIPAVNTVLMAQKLIENGNRIPAEMINADGNKQRKYDDEGRYRIYNPEDSFVGIYTYKAETDDFKPVKIFME